MIAPNPSAGAPAIAAVLSALERLAGDLRRQAEEAESRAVAAEKRAKIERQAREVEVEARHAAEARAAVAEQSARDAVRRAETAETVARESVAQLRRDLLDAIQEVVAAVQAPSENQAAARPDRFSAERLEDPYRLEQNQELSDTTESTSGRMHGSSRPARRRWNKEVGYAWIEDEPGPPWWRRIFGKRY